MCTFCLIYFHHRYNVTFCFLKSLLNDIRVLVLRWYCLYSPTGWWGILEVTISSLWVIIIAAVAGSQFTPVLLEDAEMVSSGFEPATSRSREGLFRPYMLMYNTWKLYVIVPFAQWMIKKSFFLLIYVISCMYSYLLFNKRIHFQLMSFLWRYLQYYPSRRKNWFRVVYFLTV